MLDPPAVALTFTWKRSVVPQFHGSHGDRLGAFMRRYVTSLLLALFACFTQSHAAEPAIPKDLEDWRGWVLHGEEFRRCPFIASRAPTDRDVFRCAWPAR